MLWTWGTMVEPEGHKPVRGAVTHRNDITLYVQASRFAPGLRALGIGECTRGFQNRERRQRAVNSILVRFGIFRGHRPEAGHGLATAGSILLKPCKTGCELLRGGAECRVICGAVQLQRGKRPPAEFCRAAFAGICVPASFGSFQTP